MARITFRRWGFGVGVEGLERKNSPVRDFASGGWVGGDGAVLG